MFFEKTKEALEKIVPALSPAENGETAEETKESKRENGVLVTDYAKCGYHLDTQVSPEQLCDAVKAVDENGFFIESITGVDWIDDGEIEVIYDFSRYDFEICRVVIRTRVDRNNAKIPTITDIYAGANWHERETAEFFGIDFTGHPNLINLLLPEEADYHPLRKDFTP